MSESIPHSALVVAAHGRRGLVAVPGGRRRYMIKGRALRVVCGDVARLESPNRSQELVVSDIEERQNVLARVRDGRREIIAANLGQLIAVCAPVPAPNQFLLDRFLCAAELMGCRAAVVWNKNDLGDPPSSLVQEYSDVGYRFASVSANGDTRGLRELLVGYTSILVGQSGVGKSSLINAIVPGVAAVTGELSAALRAGTHTTTAVLMYELTDPIGARLIDTPGVRDFVPAIDPMQRIDLGFPEIAALRGMCRFADCRHSHEPDCAVKTALEDGRVSAKRYQSYHRLAGGYF